MANSNHVATIGENAPQEENAMRWGSSLDRKTKKASMKDSFRGHHALHVWNGPARPKFGTRPSTRDFASISLHGCAPLSLSYSAYIHDLTSVYKGVRHPSCWSLVYSVISAIGQARATVPFERCSMCDAQPSKWSKMWVQ